MKKVLKGAEPPLLNSYRLANTTATWKQFKNSSSRKDEVDRQLRYDQAGLCAYCEIKLLKASAGHAADFRVEHFHPKSDSTTPHNWHLHWPNLLGCCHGGTRSDVAEAIARFTSPDHSCDVPKEDKNLDGIILNPLLIPASPALFKTERTTGKLVVNNANCQTAGVNIRLAQNTIDELRLDSPRLNRFRQKVLNDLNQKILNLTAAGLSVADARSRLATILLNKDSDHHWPAFFTTIRSYLGTEAETHLHSIGYVG